MNGNGGLVGYFARNPVAANALMLLFLGGGLFAANRVALEAHPAYDPHTVTVSVPYRGATPAEVEEDITRRVEESVAGIVGVERVLSTASNGLGVVSVEHGTFSDPVEVLNAVRAAVERIENFPPPNADRPEVVRAEALRKVMMLAVTSSAVGEDALRRDAEDLRTALLTLPSVSLVSLSGAREREIQIELSEEALRQHSLTIGRVTSLVRRSSLNLSGGQLRTEAGHIVIGTLAKRTRAREFADIVLLAEPDGSVVRLRDVAVLTDGFEEERLVNEVDGQPTVFVRVNAAPGQSVRDLAEEIKRFLVGYEPPANTQVAIWQDESRFISERVSIISGNAVIGAMLVFIALLLIFDLRAALWIGMGIPISFLGALVFFDAAGMTINVLTLFGFFVVTGIVVDDAVVVGESIARQRELGLRGAKASIAGVRAVGGPVVIGGLTTVVTFCALFPLDESWGQLIRVLPVVVALVLAVSLIESFCILPGHLAHDRPWSRAPLAQLQSRARAALDGFIQGKMVRTIALSIRFPNRVLIAVALVVALAAELVFGGIVRYTAFPPSLGANLIQGELTLPAGTPFDTTAAAAEHVAAAARAVDRQVGGAVESVAVSVGRHMPAEHFRGMESEPLGSHLATVNVKFKPSESRSVTAKDFARLWRNATGEIPGVETFAIHEAAAEFTSPIVSLALIHDDETMLARATEELSEAFRDMEAIRDVATSLVAGKRRYDIRLTDAGIAAGLTVANVARQLRSAFFGAEAHRVQRGRDEIRVVVRYPSERRRSLRDLLDERIAVPAGLDVPISTVARIVEVRDYDKLLRIDGRRAATVTGWYDSRVAVARQILGELESEALPALLDRYPGLEVREHDSTREAAVMLSTLAWSFPLALLVVFGLLASQLRSFAQPFLVVASLPLAIAGAVLGHLLLGYDMTNMSLFGVIAVSGVVVNDTLILLHRYNHIRAEDPELPDVAAISAAARQRARAIFLTTATTVVGLLPMLYDKSEVLHFLVPMVISLTFGLAAASAGVLFLVPAALTLVNLAKHSRLGPLFARRRFGAA